jgi:Fur family ferric uptake transcriptional regulator
MNDAAAEGGSGTSRSTRTGADGPFDMSGAIRALRRHGQRLTPLKRAVLEQFSGPDCAFTVEELGARLDLRGDLSPLYRCLAALEQAGILTHLYLDDGCRRYDVADAFGDHHHHMVCTDCSAIVRVDGCVLAADATARLDVGGFEVNDHQVTLRGVCAPCRGGGRGLDASGAGRA